MVRLQNFPPQSCHPERSEGPAFLRSVPASSSALSVPSALIKTLAPTALATGHSSSATIPFEITFFAHPPYLTPGKSYSYKKQGGWGPRAIPPTQTVSTCATVFCSTPHQYHSMGLTPPLFSYSYALFCYTENAKPLIFSRFRTLCTKHAGWGCLSFSAPSAPLRYPFPLLAPPPSLTSGVPQ